MLPNTLVFFAEKIERSFHIFSTKIIGVFEVLTFKMLTKH